MRLKTIILHTLILLMIYAIPYSASGQSTANKKRENLIGVSLGINRSGVIIDPERDNNSSVYTLKNISLFYINYHGIWDGNHYFGFKSGISYLEHGFRLDNTDTRSDVLSIPFISQFHYDLKWMRFLLNAGGYAGYRLSKRETVFYDNDIQSYRVPFTNKDYRYDFGAIGGGGLAIILKPFEIHIECNYHFSLTYLWDPKQENTLRREFSFPTQLIFSVGILLHLN